MANERTSVVGIGELAPNFSLSSAPDLTTSLANFIGNPVVLVFYPADWSPVCGDQVSLYNEMLLEFRSHGAQLLGISVDGPWCHAAFSEHRKLEFPLLSDFEPKGRVARLYGVYDEDTGTARRALFVLDASGVVRWSLVSPDGVNPGADGIFEALDGLQWDKGVRDESIES